ncbi:hypothetical protein [Thalassospira mesophila]|nr:hypothetical protein [Thalassospira mesophila]
MTIAGLTLSTLDGLLGGQANDMCKGLSGMREKDMKRQGEQG